MVRCRGTPWRQTVPRTIAARLRGGANLGGIVLGFGFRFGAVAAGWFLKSTRLFQSVVRSGERPPAPAPLGKLLGWLTVQDHPAHYREPVPREPRGWFPRLRLGGRAAEPQPR
jgi:hypothetical protein